MKKLLSLLLAAVCVMTLWGCGKSAAPQEVSAVSTTAETTTMTTMEQTTSTTREAWSLPAPPVTRGTTIVSLDGVTLNVPMTDPDMTMPVFEPEKIEVYDAAGVQSAWGLMFVPVHRSIYYKIPGCISNLIENEAFDEFLADYNKKNNYFKDNQAPAEMMLKEFAEYFNIPKNIFTAAVLSDINVSEQMGKEYNTNEDNELPNPDIIYTFDNKIISEYYQRK